MRPIAAVLAILLGAHALFAQDAAPAFEIASVKPNVAADGMIMVDNQGDRYRAVGITLEGLLRSAYEIQESQIAGAPEWARSERFDIIATRGGAARAQVPAMLRTLLAERFGLKTHREMRDMPVFAIVKARPDGRLGPQLRPSATDCGAPPQSGGGGGAALPPQPGAAPIAIRCGTSIGPGVILAGSRTMAQFAMTLAALSNTGMTLNRPVIDRTELQGTYDLELRFAPDQGPPGTNQTGASIFTAMQEQLGLKLEATRGPVEMIVIDAVHRPTPD